MVNNENIMYLDYYSTHPVVMKVGSMSAEDLIQAAKVIFIEFGLPQKIVSELSTILAWFKKFCRHLNIDQAVTSSYHHQSNG